MSVLSVFPSLSSFNFPSCFSLSSPTDLLCALGCPTFFLPQDFALTRSCFPKDLSKAHPFSTFYFCSNIYCHSLSILMSYPVILFSHIESTVVLIYLISEFSLFHLCCSHEKVSSTKGETFPALLPPSLPCIDQCLRHRMCLGLNTQRQEYWFKATSLAVFQEIQVRGWER